MPTVTPPSLPQHLRIVALETFFTPIPKPLRIPAPYTYDLVEYDRTPPELVAERIVDADIVISTVVAIPEAAIAAAAKKRLRLIAVIASGVDSVDLAACTRHGVRVLNSPHCNKTALAEHVLGLYLATRRSMRPLTRRICCDRWSKTGSTMTDAYQVDKPPRGCQDETVAVIGYGGVGKEVERVMAALGMKVIVAGRKGQETAVPEGRVAFKEAIKTASVIVVCCPRTPDTLGLIGPEEFASMQPDTLLINVSRGGVVEESVLLEALRKKQIAGVGLDVNDIEPADRKNSPIVAAVAEDEEGELNVVLTGHTAWVSHTTIANYQRALQENLEGFIKGELVEGRIKA